MLPLQINALSYILSENWSIQFQSLLNMFLSENSWRDDRSIRVESYNKLMCYDLLDWFLPASHFRDPLNEQ